MRARARALAKWPRNVICEFYSRTATRPFLLFLCSSLCRSGDGEGGNGVGFHRDTMMNAAMSASRRETAWPAVVRAIRMWRILYTRIARKLGFTRFRVYTALLDVFSRLRTRAGTLDLFALHFTRFSSRKSASVCTTQSRAMQRAPAPVSSRRDGVKICMRFRASPARKRGGNSARVSIRALVPRASRAIAARFVNDVG